MTEETDPLALRYAETAPKLGDKTTSPDPISDPGPDSIREVFDEASQRRLQASAKAKLFGDAAEFRIGRYRVEHPLGAGGMGVVYRAVDEQLARKVALKVLRAGTDAKARRRFVREAQAMARISHPNVVSVYEIVDTGDEVCIAMELVQGATLAKWLSQPREPEEILEVFEAAARGLSAAHARGLIHRDFKPGNVMVADGGRVLVTDFGLAKATFDPATMTDGVRAGALLEDMTTQGKVMGTPGYMAPEQFDGLEASTQTDQFSFCVALWEALYGQRPFVGDTLLDLSCAVSTGAIVVPDDTRGVPAAWQAALRRGLEAEPQARWPSLDALLDALRQPPAEPAGAPVTGSSAAPTSAAANRRVWLGVGVLVLVLGAALALALTRA